jgi:hypothetical protein
VALFPSDVPVVVMDGISERKAALQTGRLELVGSVGGSGCAAAGDEERPLFTFGVITDVQYADIEDGASFRGVPRFYRHSLQGLRRAVAAWRAQGVAFAMHLGDIIDGCACALCLRRSAAQRFACPSCERVALAFGSTSGSASRAHAPYVRQAVVSGRCPLERGSTCGCLTLEFEMGGASLSFAPFFSRC